MAEHEEARPVGHRTGHELADQGSSSPAVYEPSQPVASVEEAHRLTDRIKLLVGSMAEQVEKLKALLVEAQTTDVHVVLGYRSWPAYLAAVFDDTPLHLDRGGRREVVNVLTGAGMSTRAIATVVGVDQATVVRDRSGDANASPAPVLGVDGKTYTSPSPHPVPVARKAPRRHPLTDQWRANQRELTKVVERYERHVADDRLKANQEALAARHGRELGELIERLSEVHRQLTEDGGPR